MPEFITKLFTDIVQLFPQLAQAFGTSVLIFLLTLLFGLPLGMPIALCRMSKSALLREPAKLLLVIVRGTPLMLQIIFIYFAPYFLFKIPIGTWRFPAVITAFSVNYACYFAEIYRGGLESIPSGQHDASTVLGFSRSQAFLHIVLPQVIKRILPPMSNEVITLIKDTALAQTVAVLELFRVANAALNSRGSLLPVIMAGVFYLFGSMVITHLFNYTEKKLSYYK
ncbi:MAG: amino acid ABC transporter permease [Eubacteriales bacterium]